MLHEAVILGGYYGKRQIRTYILNRHPTVVYRCAIGRFVDEHQRGYRDGDETVQYYYPYAQQQEQGECGQYDAYEFFHACSLLLQMMAASVGSGSHHLCCV